MKLNNGEHIAVLPEFLAFRRLVAPGILKFFFWPAVVTGIYYNTCLTLLTSYNIDLLTVTSGILLLRVALECLFLYTYLRKTA